MCGSWLIGRRSNGWGILRRCPCCTRLNRLDVTIRYADIYIYICIFFSMRNKTRFDLPSNFRSIGSAEEVQQSEGVQSVAQERGEVHEDLSNVSGHLSVDGQDRDTKQSHRQRRRCARMRGESGGKEGSVFRAIEVHPAGVKRSSANRGGDRDIFHSDSIQIPPLISLFTSAKRNVYPARVRQRNRKKER